MDDDGKLFVWMVLGAIALVAVFVIGAMLLQAQACDSKGRAMQRPTEWGVFQGCMVKTRRGRWVPLENYREFNYRGGENND